MKTFFKFLAFIFATITLLAGFQSGNWIPSFFCFYLSLGWFIFLCLKPVVADLQVHIQIQTAPYGVLHQAITVVIQAVTLVVGVTKYKVT